MSTTTARRGLFNDDRTDVPDLSPPAPPAPPPEPIILAPRLDGGAPAVRPATARESAPPSRDVAQPQQGSGSVYTRVHVRTPAPLSEALNQLLVGQLELPSYTQIVTWTCQDHPQDVIAELTRESDQQRIPARRRAVTPTVPVNLKFRGEQLAALLDLIPGGPDAVTRTAAVIASFRVAVKHGIPS